jgi:phosphoribosylaminoimidazole-succinocarboxamide synthase
MPAALHRFADQLDRRSMLVRKLEIIPVECVVRGYLAGSGWSEYQKTRSICGVPLPAGLRLSDRLPEPTFTPTTKAKSGHDLPMRFAEVEKEVGAPLARRLRDRSIEVYNRAAGIAAARGIILCDTKFEWGLVPGSKDGEIVLADEVLTPDSSRFWLAADYRPGERQEAFDKQYVRDYLNGLDWDKTPPGPELPPEVIEGTARRYREIYELLTGKKWAS